LVNILGALRTGASLRILTVYHAHICLRALERNYLYPNVHTRAETLAVSVIRYAFLGGARRVLFLFNRVRGYGRLQVDKERCKEVTDMLSLELIGVLGALFGFLVLGMVRTQLAAREARDAQRADEGTPRPIEETR
jgi:hypothetical protein